MGPGPGRAMRQATKIILSITLVLALLGGPDPVRPLAARRAIHPGIHPAGPLSSTHTYLLDMEGRVVKTWKSDCNARPQSPTCWRTATCSAPAQSVNPPFPGSGGAGGRIQEFTWDGELSGTSPTPTTRSSCGTTTSQLPNGNVLLIVWEQKTARGGHRRRPPAGDGQRQAPGGRLARRDQADRQNDRRGRVGVARLGPPGPGLRHDQGELSATWASIPN